MLIRTSTERPEVLDCGTVIIGGIDEKDILSAVDLAVAMREEPVSTVGDYSDVNVSVKVVKLIESYVKIINKDVWRKA